MKNDRKNKIPVGFFGKLFQYDKTEKYLKEAENYDIVFYQSKKARQVTNPKESLVARDFI